MRSYWGPRNPPGTDTRPETRRDETASSLAPTILRTVMRYGSGFAITCGAMRTTRGISTLASYEPMLIVIGILLSNHRNEHGQAFRISPTPSGSSRPVVRGVDSCTSIGLSQILRPSRYDIMPCQAYRHVDLLSFPTWGKPTPWPSKPSYGHVNKRRTRR